MKILFFVFALLFSMSAFSQSKKKSRKVSNNKGTIYASWGYHRSVYTNSDLHLIGSGYDFTLENSKGNDNQSKLSSGDYSLQRMSVPQYNFKIGYYYMKKWSIAIGVDHMKYIYADHNEVKVTGNVTYPIQDVYLGNSVPFTNVYQYSQDATTDRSKFHYQNSTGLNYIHAELAMAQKIYVVDKKGNFILSSNFGLGAGALLSYTTLLFNNVQGPTTKSVSGYGLSAFGGLRFEFYKRAYLYSNLSLGFLHKVNEKTNGLDGSAYARQHMGYSMFEVGVGLFVFKKVKNGCDDCPVW
jgi:hypothetical protein